MNDSHFRVVVGILPLGSFFQQTSFKHLLCVRECCSAVGSRYTVMNTTDNVLSFWNFESTS